MKIIISGATGLIGNELTRQLTLAGHSITILTRTPNRPGPGNYPTVPWDINSGVVQNPALLEDHHAVIHLAGESIADGRWTPQKKQRIRDSRVNATRLLTETLARLQRPPATVVSASAIGFYGDTRAGEILTEQSGPGSGFLADVCREWETQALRAADFGARVVLVRTGIVLSPAGGTLAKLLPLFKLGLGGKLGSGDQWMSWISLSDGVAAIQFALNNQSIAGPVNLTSPHPATNAEFTKTLARSLSRPAVLSVPSVILKLALGEMADMVLGSLRVLPNKLQAADYNFIAPTLEAALVVETKFGATHEESRR